ncbi:MAG: Gfo/Idh/MocA family oxidoreductase [Clostridiales bacterium]|nr:Gfo/Idh/MocA family oxidoreductase [Clostridiales bacterium]
MKLVIIGVSGYAKAFIEALFLNKPNEQFEVVGFIYPKSRKSPIPSQLIDNNVPQYDSLDEFYENDDADLVIISSPINLHLEQTITSLRNGSNVLCEKPIAATIQDAREMERVSKETNKFVAVGFQWSFCEPILSLKKDILDGMYGKAISAKTVVEWPRTIRYYNRASWAGKIMDNYGNWVLDSVANNATAHFLHNMLFLLGDDIDKASYPETITAETYRANDIENYDTFAGKIRTKNGVDLLFLASHAVKDSLNPIFEFVFEKGKVTFDFSKDSILYGHKEDGTTKAYGNPFDDEMKKIFTCIKTIRNEDEIPCPIDAAVPQLMVINAVSEEVPITQFPKDVVVSGEIKGETLLYVEGMNEILDKCYEQEKLPSEMGYKWAISQPTINVTNYTKFTSAKNWKK